MGELRRFLKKLTLDREKRRRAMAVLCVLSLVVASGVSWTLRIVGITMADVPSCGLPEHTHSAQCYQTVLVCGHDEVPWETEPQETESLPTEPEETETQATEPAETETQATESEETEPQATEPAETETQATEPDETETQTREPSSASAAPTEPHVHTAACFAQQLICTLEEHTHSLACYADPHADLETADDWTAALPALGDQWAANVLAVAESQMGYSESQRNYILAEDGTTKQGYTRYGAWYGNPYGGWNAMFASFCLHYAGVEKEFLPYGSGAYAWAAALGAAELLTEELPEPLTGTLVFYDSDEDNSIDRVGIARALTRDELDRPVLHLIEGDVEGAVSERELTLEEKVLTTFCPIPEKPEEGVEATTETTAETTAETTETTEALEEQPVYDYQDPEGTMMVSVQLAPEAEPLPEDAQLTVTAIPADSGEYAALAARAEEAVAGTVEQIVLYDISFFTADGAYLPVSAGAEVNFRFAQLPVSAEGREVAVLHFGEGVEQLPTELSEIQLFGEDPDNTITTLTFETKGFSVFAVVSYTTSLETETTPADGLEGAYYIMNRDGLRGLLGEVSGDGIKAVAPAGENNFSNLARWDFRKVSGSDYIISTGNPAKYLRMSGVQLSLVEEEAQATKFNVTLDDAGTRYFLRAYTDSDQDAPSGNYINSYGSQTTGAFKGYGSADEGSRMRLYRCPEPLGELVEGLDGRSFAIVNAGNMDSTTGISMQMADKDSGQYRMGKAVTFYSEDTLGRCVIGEGVTPWTFSAVEGKPGVYHISAGEGQYLSIERVRDDQYGIFLRNTPQEITVSKDPNNTGRVALTVHMNDANWYITQMSGNPDWGFAAEPDNGQGEIWSDAWSYHYLCELKQLDLVTDLDGRSFAIVNPAPDGQTGIAMQAENGNSSIWRKGKTVPLISSDDGEIRAGGTGITQWKFEEVADKPGVYYISTTIDDTIKYLKFGSAQTQAGVSLSTEKQEITVHRYLDDSGRVALISPQGLCTAPGYTDSVWQLSIPGRNANSGFVANRDGNVRVEESYHYLLETMEFNGLLYDVNLPNTFNHSWRQKATEDTLQDAPAPSITSIYHFVEESGTLFDEPSGRSVWNGISAQKYALQNPGTALADNPYANLYRAYSRVAGGAVDVAGGVLSQKKMDYKEYTFLGWSYMVGETKHVFAPSASYTREAENGGIVLTDINGEVVTVPAETTLKGEWLQIAAPVFFFVNHTGTILDTQDNVHPQEENLFLNGVAFAWLFYGGTKAGRDDTFALSIHNEISSLFVNLNMLDLPSTIPKKHAPQIFIEAATDKGMKFDTVYAEGNARVIEEASLEWIRTAADKTISIITPSGEKTNLDSDLANRENYEIHWYVMKEQGDGWHIDGVMVAKTAELTVTKSLAGLSSLVTDQTKLDTLRSTIASNFNIYLVAGSNTLTRDANGRVTGGYYTTLPLHPENNDTDVYKFTPYNETTGVATWTVRVPVGEKFTLYEDGYQPSPEALAAAGIDGEVLMNAYSIIDGNAGTLHFGTETGYQVDPSLCVEAGVTDLVAFRNTYTLRNKATLAVLKENAITGNVMQGVTFGLFDENGTELIQPSVTNAMGVTGFTELDPGTYILKEIVPQGFVGYKGDGIYGDAIAQVQVTGDDSQAAVTVTPTGGGPALSDPNLLVYTVKNQPENSTFIVKKNFKGIKKEEVESLKTTYQIELTDDGGHQKITLTLDGHEIEGMPTVGPSYVGQDGLNFTWRITGFDLSGAVTAAESGFIHDGYADTQILATLEVTKDGETEVTDLSPDKQAAVNFDVGRTEDLPSALDGSYLLTLRNVYTNTFSLVIEKRDTHTEAPLAGARFAVYGEYEEAMLGNQSIKYNTGQTDANGAPVYKTLYLIGETAATDADGEVQIRGLKLTNSGRTYALLEVQAPPGYAPPLEKRAVYDTIVPDTASVLDGSAVTTTIYEGGLIVLDGVQRDTVVNNVVNIPIVNQVLGKELRIIKKIPENDTVSGPFTFTITIQQPAPSIRTANRQYTYTVFNADGTEKEKNGPYTGTELPGGYNRDKVTIPGITLAKGESFVIDIPVGYEYTVKEDPGDYYTDMVNKNETGFYNTAARTVHGSIEEMKDNTVEVWNRSVLTEATTTIRLAKKWTGDPGGPVTVHLYRRIWKQGDPLDKFTYAPFDTVIFDADSISKSADSKAELVTGQPWRINWSGLPLYEMVDGDKLFYDYYISEEGAGLMPEYSMAPVEIEVEGKKVEAVHVTTAMLTITNHSGFKLPESGGAGTIWLTLTGAGLMAAACWLALRSRRKT